MFKTKLKKSKLKNKEERGSILILAVIVLVNALFIVVAISSISIIGHKMSLKTRNTAPAFQAADSGIEYILGEYKEDASQKIQDVCDPFVDGKCTINNIGLDKSVEIYFLENNDDNEKEIITNRNTSLNDVNYVRSVGKYGEGGYQTTRALEVTLIPPETE